MKAFGGTCNFCLSLQEASTNKADEVVPIISDDVIRKCSNPSIDGVGTEFCDEFDDVLQRSLLDDESDSSSDDE